MIGVRVQRLDDLQESLDAEVTEGAAFKNEFFGANVTRDPALYDKDEVVDGLALLYDGQLVLILDLEKGSMKDLRS